jgi:hypothetical protein
MKWMRERDSLIAQTMAFVQTVAGKKEDAVPRVRIDATRSDFEIASLDAIRNALDIVEPPKEVLKQALKETVQATPPRSVQPARPIVPSEMQNEIRSRIANFRAHQERFNRERAEYFNATLTRLRAAIDEARAANIGK